MRYLHTLSLLLFLLLFLCTSCHRRMHKGKMTPQQYVATYKRTARKQMKAHGIPASITLAQGMLESGNGNSELARKAHNHFGIKCTPDWHGRSYRVNDDKPNECFRRYRHAKASFQDHADFLQKKRYQPLYELKRKDYKGWAHGLKKAGYATNPRYANLLIDMIEKHRLYRYDR